MINRRRSFARWRCGSGCRWRATPSGQRKKVSKPAEQMAHHHDRPRATRSPSTHAEQGLEDDHRQGQRAGTGEIDVRPAQRAEQQQPLADDGERRYRDIRTAHGHSRMAAAATAAPITSQPPCGRLRVASRRAPAPARPACRRSCGGIARARPCWIDQSDRGGVVDDLVHGRAMRPCRSRSCQSGAARAGVGQAHERAEHDRTQAASATASQAMRWKCTGTGRSRLVVVIASVESSAGAPGRCARSPGSGAWRAGRQKPFGSTSHTACPPAASSGRARPARRPPSTRSGRTSWAARCQSARPPHSTCTRSASLVHQPPDLVEIGQQARAFGRACAITITQHRHDPPDCARPSSDKAQPSRPGSARSRRSPRKAAAARRLVLGALRPPAGETQRAGHQHAAEEQQEQRDQHAAVAAADGVSIVLRVHCDGRFRARRTGEDDSDGRHRQRQPRPLHGITRWRSG